LEPDQALPEDGVYATLAHVGDKVHQSVTNIGVKPTFGKGARTVEVHILGFTGDLYGQKLTIELVERLRAEMKFAGPEELAAQIKKDVEQARSILKDGVSKRESAEVIHPSARGLGVSPKPKSPPILPKKEGDKGD
jgi:riboflavin kinase/FMN adenylyltransferase